MKDDIKNAEHFRRKRIEEKHSTETRLLECLTKDISAGVRIIEVSTYSRLYHVPPDRARVLIAAALKLLKLKHGYDSRGDGAYTLQPESV